MSSQLWVEPTVGDAKLVGEGARTRVAGSDAITEGADNGDTMLKRIAGGRHQATASLLKSSSFAASRTNA